MFPFFLRSIYSDGRIGFIDFNFLWNIESRTYFYWINKTLLRYFMMSFPQINVSLCVSVRFWRLSSHGNIAHMEACIGEYLSLSCTIHPLFANLIHIKVFFVTNAIAKHDHSRGNHSTCRLSFFVNILIIIVWLNLRS